MTAKMSVQELVRSTGALLEGHFLLSSGLHSDQYVQCARLFQSARDAEYIGGQLANSAPKGAEIVVSPALGGILIGYEVARALNLPYLFTERVDGKMALRRGFAIGKEQKVVIVEDVFTTGKSTNEVADVIEGLSGRVVGALSVINRGLKADTFRFPFASLLTLSLKTWKPEECPLCMKGAPLEKPGSRTMPAAARSNK